MGVCMRELEKRIYKPTLSLEELILGFMRYAQMCHSVRDFPAFLNPAWQNFLYTVMKELNGRLPNSLELGFTWTDTGPLIIEERQLDIVFALGCATITDHKTGRMYLDTEESIWGRELVEVVHFRNLLEPLFEIALSTPDFISFG